MIDVNNGEVAEFLVLPPGDFCSFKNAWTVTPLCQNNEYH